MIPISQTGPSIAFVLFVVQSRHARKTYVKTRNLSKDLNASVQLYFMKTTFTECFATLGKPRNSVGNLISPLNAIESLKEIETRDSRAARSDA